MASAEDLREMTSWFESLAEWHGFNVTKIPGWAAFVPLADRLREIDLEVSTHLARLADEEVAAAAAYAHGTGSLAALLAAADSHAAGFDSTRRRIVADRACSVLASEAVEALAGHDEWWREALWPLIDKAISPLRELSRSTVEALERCALNQRLPNPLDTEYALHAAYSRVVDLYGVWHNLIAKGVLPGAELSLPPEAWRWRASAAELATIPRKDPWRTNTVEVAVLAMARGFEPSLNSLADVERLNNAGRADGEVEL